MLVEVAVWTLSSLTHQSGSAADAISAAGGFAPLVHLLGGGFGAAAAEHAAWTICNLAAESALARDSFR